MIIPIDVPMTREVGAIAVEIPKEFEIEVLV